MSGSSAYDQDCLRTRARWAECTKIFHSDRLENVARHTFLIISLRLSRLTRIPVSAPQRMSRRQWHPRQSFFNLAIELVITSGCLSSSPFKPNGSLTARTPAEPNTWCLVCCCGTTTDCPWCIIDTDSVLRTIKDFSVFQSLQDIVIEPLWQFRL